MFGDDEYEPNDSISSFTSGSPQQRIGYLNEICTMLCIAMEEYIISFDLYSTVPALTNALPHIINDQNEEEVILIVRALALILDVVPRSCPIVVSSGSVPKIVTLLKEKTSASLTEELLKCLDKISIENPEVLMTIGIVPILLQCLAIFNESLKLAALRVVSNLCRREDFKLEGCVEVIGERLSGGSDDEIELICQVNFTFEEAIFTK